MQTYSHFLATAVASKNKSVNQSKIPLLAGSISPDIPLAIISIGYIIDRRFIRPHLPDKTRCSPTYNDLYFNNPWWIAAHNLLHAPLMVLLLGMMGYFWRHTRWGHGLFSFAIGCGGHSAIDILTHADDGPVLFFPLDWHTRFPSPLSYWDPAHGGRVFRILEHLLDGLLIGWLIFQHKKAK